MTSSMNNLSNVSLDELAALLEERFFPIFQYAAVGFAKVGLQCEWLRVNQKLCQITGYTEAELLGMTFCEMTHPDDLALDLQNMQAVIAGDMPINVMEKRYIRKDGFIVWIHLTAALVRNHAGQPEYFITIIEDITARKASEKALLQSNKDLENFATVVAYNLLDPLRKALAFNEFIQKDTEAGVTESLKDYFSRMQALLRRMQFLVSDLYHFSKVIKQQKPFVRVNVSDIILEAIGELTQYRLEVGGHIEFFDTQPLWAWGNAEQLQQAFQNLIENALKFHAKDRPPEVKITTLLEANRCEIVIEDNGIGFPEEQMERMFEMFQTYHADKNYSGTGIGLALARKIIEQHHGTIVAHSTPGKGSIFVVKLPTKLSEDLSRSFEFD